MMFSEDCRHKNPRAVEFHPSICDVHTTERSGKTERRPVSLRAGNGDRRIEESSIKGTRFLREIVKIF